MFTFSYITLLKIRACFFCVQGDNDAIPGFGMTQRDHHMDDVNHGRFTKQPRGKKAGAFQGMGLSYDVIQGITKRGYKIPTPIQRKVY